MATKKTTKKAAPEKKATKKVPVKNEVKHITPELIKDVLDGKYGPEGERNHKLLAAGYSPSAVTKKLRALEKMADEVRPVIEKSGDYWALLVELACSK